MNMRKTGAKKPGSKKAGSGNPTGRGPSGRGLTQRVKSARGRKKSSTKWLQRQLNDPYVQAARADGWRSRAAYKLMELDDRFDFLKPGQRVVDLGAAPGGWTQVVVKRTNSENTDGPPRVVGIDYLEWEGIAGATCIVKDFQDDDAPEVLKAALGGWADVVLSDMAAPTTGHAATDHLRIMALLELAWHFAEEVLAEEGTFVAKVFQGGTESELLARMKKRCRVVRHAKPPASRSDSAEIYVVAQGFRRQKADDDAVSA